MKKRQSKEFPIVPKLQFDNIFRQLCFQIFMAEQEIAFIRAAQFLFDLTKSEVWDEESPTGRRQVALPKGSFLFYVALMKHPGQRLLCSDIFPTAKPSRQPRLASRALDDLKRLLGADHVKEYIDSKYARGYALNGPIEFLDANRNVIRQWKPEGLLPVDEVLSQTSENQKHELRKRRFLERSTSPKAGVAGDMLSVKPEMRTTPRHMRDKRHIFVRATCCGLVLLLMVAGAGPFFWVRQEQTQPFLAGGGQNVPSNAAIVGIEWQAPPLETRILLADIDGPDKDQYRVTESILTSFRFLEAKYPTIKVEPLGRSVGEKDALPDPHPLMQLQVAMFIRGWYALTKTTVQLHLYFTSYSQWTQDISRTEPLDFTVPVQEFEDFRLTHRISKILQTVALVADGLLFESRRDAKSAEQAFREALQNLPKEINRDTIVLLIAHVQLPKYPDEALQTLRLIQKPEKLDLPLRVAFYQIRGEAHLFNQELDLMRTDIHTAVVAGERLPCGVNTRSCSGYLGALAWSAKIAETDGNLLLAVSIYQKASMHSTDPFYHVQSAALLRRMQSFDPAIKELNAAIDEVPWKDSLYNDRGLVEYQKGDYANSLKDFNQAISMNSREPIFFANRARVLHAIGKVDAEKSDLIVAVKGFKSGHRDRELMDLCNALKAPSPECQP